MDPAQPGQDARRTGLSGGAERAAFESMPLLGAGRSLSRRDPTTKPTACAAGSGAIATEGTASGRRVARIARRC